MEHDEEFWHLDSEQAGRGLYLVHRFALRGHEQLSVNTYRLILQSFQSLDDMLY